MAQLDGTARWFKFQRGTVIEWTAQVDVSNDSIAQSSGWTAQLDVSNASMAQSIGWTAQ